MLICVLSFRDGDPCFSNLISNGGGGNVEIQKLCGTGASLHLFQTICPCPGQGETGTVRAGVYLGLEIIGKIFNSPS